MNAINQPQKTTAQTVVPPKALAAGIFYALTRANVKITTATGEKISPSDSFPFLYGAWIMAHYAKEGRSERSMVEQALSLTADWPENETEFKTGALLVAIFAADSDLIDALFPDPHQKPSILGSASADMWGKFLQWACDLSAQVLTNRKQNWNTGGDLMFLENVEINRHRKNPIFNNRNIGIQ